MKIYLIRTRVDDFWYIHVKLGHKKKSNIYCLTKNKRGNNMLFVKLDKKIKQIPCGTIVFHNRLIAKESSMRFLNAWKSGNLVNGYEL